jgi:hypothetical protein
VGNLGILYDHLVYFKAIGNIFGHLVYFVVIWYIFPRLVSCTKKNLVTLVVNRRIEWQIKICTTCPCGVIKWYSLRLPPRRLELWIVRSNPAMVKFGSYKKDLHNLFATSLFNLSLEIDLKNLKPKSFAVYTLYIRAVVIVNQGCQIFLWCNILKEGKYTKRPKI